MINLLINPILVIMKWSESSSVMSDSLRPQGLLQARILEWVAFPFSRGFSQSRDWTQVSHIAGRFFTNWTIREALWTWTNSGRWWGSRKTCVQQSTGSQRVRCDLVTEQQQHPVPTCFFILLFFLLHFLYSSYYSKLHSCHLFCCSYQ